MTKELQIKKWMLEGLSDEVIQEKLDELDSQAQEDYRQHMISVMDEDEPAPAPGPAKDTVQNMFNRTVVAITDVYDKNIAHTDSATGDVKTVVTAGYIAADTALKAAVEAYADAQVCIWKGQIFSFNETHAKFENTTLFTKHTMTTGMAILGTTSIGDWTHTEGEVKSHNHTQAGHDHNVYNGDGLQGNLRDKRSWGVKVENGAFHMSFASFDSNNQSNNPFIATETPIINSTGGNENIAAGFKAIHVVYIAKKDITVKEMK